MAKINVTPQEMAKIINKSRNNSEQTEEMKEQPKMKNKLTDLNNHLFAELERLSDEYLSEDKLKSEIERAKAIADISSQVIDNASLTLKTAQFLTDSGYGLNGTVEQNIMGYIGNTPKE